MVGVLDDAPEGLQLGQDHRRERRARPSARARAAGPARRRCRAAPRTAAPRPVRRRWLAAERASSAVPGSMERPCTAESRAARSSRIGSSRNARSDAARSRRASESARPPVGSIGSPPASGIAIALIVKSRARRSSSIVPARSAATSTCQPSVGATARQVACFSESGKAEPPATLAIARAALCSPPGSTARSASATCLESRASRIAPPTIQARPPCSSAARAAAIEGAASRAPKRLLIPGTPAAPVARSRR